MPTKAKKARTIDERLDQLTTVVETLAGTVGVQSNQIGALLRIAENHAQSIANLEKQWQAYINTLPRN